MDKNTAIQIIDQANDQISWGITKIKVLRDTFQDDKKATAILNEALDNLIKAQSKIVVDAKKHFKK